MGATGTQDIYGGGAVYADNLFVMRVSSMDDEVADGNLNFKPIYSTTPFVWDGLYNGSFEVFPTTQNIADGWDWTYESFGSGYAWDRVSPGASGIAGTTCQEITNLGGLGGTSLASRPFPVTGGVGYQFSAYAKSTLANPGSMYLRVSWYNAPGAWGRTSSTFISANDIVANGGPTVANTWQFFTGQVTSPANAKYCRIAIYNWSSGQTVSIAFDQLSFHLANISMDSGALVDGTNFVKITPDEKTGAGRAKNTINGTNQIISSFNGQPLNSNATTTVDVSLILKATQGSHVVSVASFSIQWGGGLKHYNAGSVTTPATFGTYIVYFDDPTFAAGAVVYKVTQDATQLYQDGRIAIGSITTAAASPPPPAQGGGGPNGGFSCFSGNVTVKTVNGWEAFSDLPPVVEIVNETGTHTADLIVHEGYEGWCVSLPGDWKVTTDHPMKSGDKFVDAYIKYSDREIVKYSGTVYNLHVRTENEADRHYILGNGDVAHNKAKIGSQGLPD